MKSFITTLLVVLSFVASANTETGKNGMVASRSMLASSVGADILKQGGNAIDAAVATGFALAVTYPSAGNLGGGGFAVVHLANGDVTTLDHRERAPAAATRDMYLDENGELVRGLSTRSHKATGIPGTVDGLLLLLEAHGTMSRQQVMAAAIKLARDGFALPEDLAGQFKRRLKSMENYPASMAKFSKQGKPYQVGDQWRQLDLADTLQRISDQGRDGFYKGHTAELIVAEMLRGNGLISAADLTNYKSVWREPIHVNYKGHGVYMMPPPSSGGVLIAEMLNMMEPYKIETMGWGSKELVHLMIEAERRAYADRSEHLGDPDFYPVPIKKLSSKSYARQRFTDFNPKQATRSDQVGAGQWIAESTETSHFSVMDSKGNAVSITTTLNLGFGSKIVVSGAGFLLNNEMDDFSSKQNTPNSYGLIGRVANEIQPGKTMLSSMTPSIVVKDKQPILVTGSPGGSTIITTVFQVILNVLAHGMSVEEAVSKPRFHHQWMPDRVRIEADRVSTQVSKELQAMGHKLQAPRFSIGDANSIMRDGDIIIGVSDPRNDGGAAGF